MKHKRNEILVTYLMVQGTVVFAMFFLVLIAIANIQIIIPECKQPVINLTCRQPVCEAPIVTYKEAIDCQYSQFQNMLTDMAQEHDWANQYNCQKYSEELSRRLNDAGYSSSYMTSDQTVYGRHTIVKAEVYIEPQTGSIITPGQYKDYGLR